MALFLLILKIIGIILLSILGLILFVLLIVLFVPVRYRFSGKKGTGSKDISIRASVKWLLSIVYISFKYDYENPELVIRIFGIPIKRKSFGKRNDEKKVDEINVQENIPTARELSDKKSGLYTIESFDDFEENSSKDLKNDVPDDVFKPELVNEKCVKINDVPIIDESSCKTPDNNEYINTEVDCLENLKTESGDKKNKISFAEKIRKLYDNFSNRIVKLINSFDDFLSRQSEFADKISKEYNFYSRFFNDERNKRVFSKIISTVKRLLNSIKPRIIKGKVEMGFDDPATTGQIIAILSVLYSVFPKKLSINPHFDETLFEGNILLKGRIYVCVALWAGVRIYFDKNFKRLLHIYKRHNEKND